MAENRRLTDLEVEESAVQLLETFTAKIAAAIRERKLDGHEVNVLNIMHNGLFGLLMQCRIFRPKPEKQVDATSKQE